MNCWTALAVEAHMASRGIAYTRHPDLAELLLATHGCLYRGHELPSKEREVNLRGSQERGLKVPAVPGNRCVDNQVMVSHNGD